MIRCLLATSLLLGSAARGDQVGAAIQNALKDAATTSSKAPYSRAIERMVLGYDAGGRPQIAVAARKVDAYKTITGVVVVERTPAGFVLREALFPDINAISNAKKRNEVASVLRPFKNVPFDPHAEKSSVDGLTSATRHTQRLSGYLNYMARQAALEIEANPGWPRASNRHPASGK